MSLRFGRGFVVALFSLAWPLAAAADDWPTWRGPAGDGVWRESGVVERFASDKLPRLWTAEIGSGYSGPTVAAGRVYVTDRVVEPKQIERVHCFDAKNGKPIWTHSYDAAYRGVGYEAGPRACVAVHDGRAYSLGTMGHLFCFDAADGRILWQKDTLKEYAIEMPQWGIATTPVVFEDLLIVQIGGTPGANLVAFDRKSGEEKWRALEDGASYSTPIVIEQAGQPVLVVWTAERLCGLDPRTGKLHWATPYEPGGVRMNVSSPVFDGRRIFVSSFFDGAMMVETPKDRLEAKRLWRRKGPSEKDSDALHSTIGTPLLQGEFIYGIDSYGQMRGLKLANGDRVWEDQTAMPKERWGTLYFVRHVAIGVEGRPELAGSREAETLSRGDRVDDVWMFNERGELLIGALTPQGFQERSRAKLIDPTTDQLRRGDGVCWSHPAFADRCVFARNDRELVCASVAKD